MISGEGHSGAGRPECFGELEHVFPKGCEGFREVSPNCWDCGERVECLRTAVDGDRGEAQRLSRERIARDEESSGGVAGFMKRWSRLKRLEKEKGGS